MKNILLKTLQDKVEDLLKLYTEKKAFSEFHMFLDLNPELKNIFDSEEIENLFPKPSSFDFNSTIDTNEDGDKYTGSEFTDDIIDISIKNFTDIGWLSDKSSRNKIYQNDFYQNIVRPSIGSMPEDVKKDIELHSTHILGRCNNPSDWGENRQGLVYGMVQSGKTVSMITLMGQAMATGYRIFIVLAGDKTSLREQTQKRIDEAFDLNFGGYSNNQRKYNIRSLTKKGSDYSDVSRSLSNGLELWDIKDSKQTIIICIKKQTDNLKKLIEHLKQLEANCKEGGTLAHIANFETDFKTMIIDDEADYASQDTRPTNGGATIHNDLVAIREQLKQNCYVAYTATPQACIGANPDKLVGYPSDFIWLLEPHRDEYGETTTYLGLEEFFEKYPNQLIERLPKGAWPHIEKDDGRKIGVYNPNTDEIIDEVLTDVELEFIDSLLKDSTTRNKHCIGYKKAIVNYLIGCSIRWYRHYLKCKKDGFFDTFPTVEDIEAIEMRGKNVTVKGYKPFPYHAMMFNLSYITKSQKKIVEFVELLWSEIVEEWNGTNKNSWEDNNLFSSSLELQHDKTVFFGKNITEAIEIQPFLEYAIKITSKTIQDGNGKYIYELNATDEGRTLQYDNQTPEGRPKKAAIIVGGNILSRGLTIENLSVTVFARSQVMSLGDTNLQMCRWFGHKKGDIDLQSVYLQDHSQILFQTISESDKELRAQFRYHVFNSIPNKCLLLSLYNSPLFRNTSPSKSKFLEKGSQASYSGITIDMLEPFNDSNFKKNNSLLDDYLKSIPSKIKRIKKFERATVYENVPIDAFHTFFENMHFSENSMNISPIKYCTYLSKWRKSGVPIPNYNIAIFDVNDSGIPRNRARKSIGSVNDYKSIEELKENALLRLAPFRGGKSDPNVVKKNKEKSYCGDHFVDLPLEFHIENYKKNNLRRDKSMPILFIFYKLNANYVGKFPPKKNNGSKDVYFEEGDKFFVDTKEPLITFSIATPLGGPIFKTQENKLANPTVLNNKECEDYFEKLNNYDRG